MKNARLYKTDGPIYVTDESNTVLFPQVGNIDSMIKIALHIPENDPRRPQKVVRYERQGDSELLTETDELLKPGDVVAVAKWHNPGDCQMIRIDEIKNRRLSQYSRYGAPHTIQRVISPVSRELYEEAEKDYLSQLKQYEEQMGAINDDIDYIKAAVTQALERQRKERLAQLPSPASLADLLFQHWGQR